MLRNYLLLFIFITASVVSANAQYQPTWESLDQKPIPEWYKDAKFGIFIHWGVYSVPAYSKVGGYSEWYQQKLRSDSTSPTAQFHRKMYGDLSYYDLAKKFNAELFNPEAWAQLFENAGAKYVVLTSKHHDGYCLWPCKSNWGFPWNATKVGPKKDLIKALFTALRKTDVKPGLYYSLYEWYNPLYLNDVDAFVEQHTIPQMKDLIKTYEPYLLWTDGGWEHSAETWHAKEFLAWLYNESPVKDRIVTFDRWGGGIRFHHGMIYTPEYEPGLDLGGHYFEVSRGIGYSYGYNRAEDIEDYSSGRSLVLRLIDIVSRGGNFLLDVGPRADGKIPPIMQERLLHIGQWLAVNGEAIYGTEPWKVSYQWSEGKQNYEAGEGEMLLLKQTINPAPGYAVKEIFFTHKEDNLYCIVPQYPDRKLVVENLNVTDEAEITLLATGQELEWKNEGENLVISIPPFDPQKITVTDAYVIKIDHAPGLVQQPVIQARYASFTADPAITITSSTDDAQIYYTLDGGTPTKNDRRYTEPFTLGHSQQIKAIAFKQGWVSSNVDSAMVETYDWQEAQSVDGLEEGLVYHYYEFDEPSLAMDDTEQAVSNGIVEVVSTRDKQRDTKYGFRFTGYIKIKEQGIYTFYTTSDDGSALWVDGIKVVANGGPHGALQEEGTIALEKGYHSFEVRYFNGGGNGTLTVEMQKRGEEKHAISSNILYH